MVTWDGQERRKTKPWPTGGSRVDVMMEEQLGSSYSLVRLNSCQLLRIHFEDHPRFSITTCSQHLPCTATQRVLRISLGSDRHRLEMP